MSKQVSTTELMRLAERFYLEMGWLSMTRPSDNQGGTFPDLASVALRLGTGSLRVGLAQKGTPNSSNSSRSE